MYRWDQISQLNSAENGSISLKWTKFVREKYQRKVGQNFTKKYWDQLSQYGLAKTGINCHIMIVDSKFWHTDVRLQGGLTVRPLLDLDLDQLSHGLNSSTFEMLLGLTEQFELPLRLNEGRLNIKAPKTSSSNYRDDIN
jgi:hypothetical protein